MPANPSSANKSTEDIFAATDTTKRPRRTVAKPTPVSPLPPPAAPTSLPVFKRYSILIVIVVLVLAAGLIGLGWWLEIQRTDQTIATNSNSTNTNSSTSPLANTKAAAPGNSEPVISVNRSVEALPEDGDHDGLSDAEENSGGTNPADSDSDHDGVSDLLELKLYHSDPTSADTDRDGNPDQTEIAQGYDPAGPGKLFDLTNAVNQ